MVITRGEGNVEGRREYRGINGDGRRPDFGWLTHNTIYK